MVTFKIKLNCLNKHDAELYLKALAAKIGAGEKNIKHSSKFYSYSVIQEEKLKLHETADAVIEPIKEDAEDFIIDAAEEFQTEINEDGKTVLTIMSKFK